MEQNRDLGTREIQSIEEDSGSGRERPPSPDAILSVVASEHRRAILNSLNSASDNTLEYDALVDCVADRVRDGGTGRVSDEHRQRVRIALHHTHLPKLKDIGIIDHEPETGPIEFVGGELEQDILALVESHNSSESATHR